MVGGLLGSERTTCMAKAGSATVVAPSLTLMMMLEKVPVLP
jgi:hypothetical protein